LDDIINSSNFAENLTYYFEFMKLKIYQVDAFTDKVFAGNPAAVCPLNSWLSDELLQNIAMENYLPETAFYVNRNDRYEIRWFTPGGAEVDLCGHATLAAAFVLFNYEGHKTDVIHFRSPRSGDLLVKRNNEFLTLNFPVDSIEPVDVSDQILNCFPVNPINVFKGKTDYLFIFDNEDVIKNIQPNLPAIAQLPGRGAIVSAKGDEVDFVSRFFAPQIGIEEDPVTGSAHTTLTPYWNNILNKDEFSAIQLSKRKGYLKCRYLGDRIEISGQADLFLIGKINF